jgi:hypothetical protein
MTRTREIPRALWTAAGLIAAALLLKWLASAGLINGDVSERLIQVAIGVVLIFSANRVPKQLVKISDDGCEPSRRQSQRRLAGWAFVLAGLAYVVVWLVAPIDSAAIISLCIVGGTVLLVLVPCLWLFLRRRGGLTTGEAHDR